MHGWNNEGRTKIALNRVRNFVSELRISYIRNTVDFNMEVHVTDERIPLEKTFSLERHGISKGETWGENWKSGYFHLSADIPESLENRPLAVRLNLGGEMLVYDKNGNPLYGLTGGSAYDGSYYKNFHEVGMLSDSYELYVEAAANNLFGLTRPLPKLSRDIPYPRGRWTATVTEAEIGEFDADIYHLYIECENLLSLYDGLKDKRSVRAVRILSALLDASCEYTVNRAVSAHDKLKDVLSKEACPSALDAICIGHAHIDTAWLWPLAETHRKVSRTFSSQIYNLSKYPSYLFGASSAQHYKWTRDEHPALYEKIREEIRKGRWEILGAMWLEPDCTLTSAESLIRQIQLGKRYFRDEFSRDVRNCWIPDTFGYPATLPQILKKSGVDYFVTQKISWNSMTQFPYDTFLFRGIDGSEVVTHFLPEHSYNSDALASSIMTAEDNYLEKDWHDEFVLSVGIGDGGGGPKEDHIERVLQNGNLEGVPRARFSRIDEFLDRIDRSQLETYTGELYLELHRGTLTSQARNKRNNRIYEESLRILESLFAGHKDYPQDSFQSLMEDGALMQFHDILPGSSVGEVYMETEELYRKMEERYKSLILKYLAGCDWTAFSFGPSAEAHEGGKSVVSVYSLTSSSAPQLVRFSSFREDGEYLLEDGSSLLSIDGIFYGYLKLRAGWNSFHITSQRKLSAEDGSILENSLISYAFDADGSVSSAIDKSNGRDYIYGGKGNSLALYSDNPQNWEAWDIEFYYPKQLIPNGIRLKERELLKGSCFSVLKQVFEIGDKSTMTQYVLLPSAGKELYFVSSVDWQEQRKLLRTCFPIDSMAEKARCDISYGIVERNIQVRDEKDFAQFEFACRNFCEVDGIALSSDSKYGYSARDGRLGLSLLRSPIEPDAFADLGHQEFTYAYIPHTEALEESSVKSVSDALNSPYLAVYSDVPVTGEEVPVEVDERAVTIGAVKGESLVFRLVENYGHEISFPISLKPGLQVRECDLMENVISDKVYKDGDIITLKPFEIRTFKAI